MIVSDTLAVAEIEVGDCVRIEFEDFEILDVQDSEDTVTLKTYSLDTNEVDTVSLPFDTRVGLLTYS